ncbi:MAG: TolC family protein [Verrucomicrobiaceae bacterium]
MILISEMSVSVFSVASFFAVSSALLAASVVAGKDAAQKPLITLEQAYDRTLATDQSIAIALIEIHKANLLPLSALTRLGPQISANIGYDPSSVTTSGGSTGTSTTSGSGLMSGGTTPLTKSSSSRSVTTHTDLRRASISWQQTLLDFTVFPSYRLGKLTAESTKLQYQATVRDTLYGVARAYYDVLKQQSIVSVNQQTLDLAAEQLDQAQKRMDAGDVARTDVLRAKATLEAARKTLIESNSALALSRNTLANILNLDDHEGYVITEPAGAQGGKESFDFALNQAMMRREDYQISSIAIKQDIERRNEIKGQYGPRIVADVSQNWDRYNGSDRAQDNWSASLALQFPIFTGGQREIDMRTSADQIQQTRLNHDKLGKTIQEEVKAAWLAERTLRETIVAVRAGLEAAEQNYKDLQVQYDAGAKTNLDVQIALRDLNNARTTLTTQIYDYQVAVRDLERATASFQPLRVSKASAMLSTQPVKTPRK